MLALGTSEPSISTSAMSSRRNQRKGKNGRGTANRVTQAWKSQPGGYYIPDVFRTTLRISYERSAATSASTGQLLFQANSAFDPLGSSGSAQPVGFDPLALMYNRYRVLASRIVARIMLQPATAGPAITGATAEIALCYQNDTTNLGGVNIASSQPGAKMVLVSLQKPVTVQLGASTAHVTGRKNVQGSDSLQAAVSSDPTEVWYWASYFISGAAYTDINLELHYTIEQDVEFFDRLTLGHSLIDAALKNAVSVKNAVLAKALVDGKARMDKQKSESKCETKCVPSVSDDDDAPVMVTVIGNNRQPQAAVRLGDPPGSLKLMTPSVRSR